MFRFRDFMVEFRPVNVSRILALAAAAVLAGCAAPGDEAVASRSAASSMYPDLVVTAVDVPPSVMPGASFEVEIEVCNQGGVWAPWNELAVLSSEDAVIDELDPVLFTMPVWELGPGACARVSAPVVAPTAVGQHVLGARVDFYDSLYEDDESNNTAAATLIAGYDPDLVVERVRGPAATAPGMPVAIDVRVCNHGQSWISGADVELYLSPDDQITTADTPVGWFYTSELGPGDCESGGAEVHVYAEHDGHVLGAIVDPYDGFIELDETNNAGAGGVLQVGWDADLVITAIDAPPSTLPGQPLPVDVTVCNQGFSPSSYSDVEVHLSEDDQFDPAFDLLAGAAPIPYLDPGACAQARVPAYLHAGPEGAVWLGAVVDRWDSVIELDDDNNTRLSDPVGVGWGPDLVVTTVTGPTSGWPWEDVQATARICNHGQAPSMGTSVRFYFAGASPFGPHLGLFWGPGLEPGACANVPGTAFAPGVPGGHVLHAVVDPEGSVPELIESNNTGAGPRVAVGWDADLVVSSVTPPPGTFLPFATPLVVVSVCNHGRAPGGDVPVLLRVSRDAEPSSNDAFAGEGYAPWLEPDTCAHVPIPASLNVPEDGAYHLIAEVDPFDMAVEILDDNNATASGVIGIGYGADLVVTAIAAPPSVLPNELIHFSVTACNQGQMTSPYSEVEITASVEDEYGPVMEVFLGHAPVHHLPPSQCVAVPVQASAWLVGAYQLRAVVDRWDYVSEILEGNNAFQGGLMGVGYDADLVVTAVSGPPSAMPGASIDVSVRVCNLGQGWSAGAPVEVYFSSDPEIAPGDMPMGWADAGSLAPDACVDVPVPVYAHWQPDVYVLGAIVDPYRYVPELVERNNARAGERIGVGWDADLVVTSVSGPPTALPWMDMTVTARVCNHGQSPSYGAWVDAVLSADPDVGATDLLMGGAPVSSLEPGACEDLTILAHPPVPSGVYTLGAVVYSGGAPELIADNNARAGGLLGVGHDGDLVITAVTGPASAPVWSEIVVSVEVCNQGQAPTYDTWLDVVLSSDGSVDAGDIPVGSAGVGMLEPGACRTVELPVWPFQPEGNYVLGALIDPGNNVWEIIESNNATAGASIELTPY